MRDRANDLAILQNRAAAPSLHPAAGLRKKLLVRHAQQLRRLIRLGLYDAASLLHTRDGLMAIGPYASFQESQDALVRVATTHPGASIMLAEKNSMAPAVQAVAENQASAAESDGPARGA